MQKTDRHPLITGARVNSLGTLASRVLGMVRDMSMAALFGLAGSGIMDAFVIAYRIPNLFRRLFGEGALTASYLPVLAAELERGPRGAWRLASVVLTWLVIVLAGLVVAGEGLLAVGWWLLGDVPGLRLLLGLAAVLLPFVLTVCVAAQLAATLHVLSHFTVPAFAPVVLNACWLAAIWLLAPCFQSNREAHAYVIACAILLAGVLQVGGLWTMLRRLGFRYEYHWPASRTGMSRIGAALGPMVFGLAVTQINSLVDSLIAWGLAARPGSPAHVPWLPGAIGYPMEQGAAAAIYYGERLYHFPMGVLGMAVAAAIFPLLSRHAARGDRRLLGRDLTLGMRLITCLGVPAGVGLIMLAEPLARLLFEHRAFTPEDTLRTARMIQCYGGGVWAFCALPVLVRGFYATGVTRTPVTVAAWIVGLNLALNLTLIWPLAETGLAVASAASATVQVLVLLVIFSRHQSHVDWPALGAAAARTLAASGLMAVAGLAALRGIAPVPGLANELARVFVPIALSVAVYWGTYRLLGGRELGMVLRGVDQRQP